MATKLEASRLLTEQAAKAYDSGKRSDLQAGMAKLFATETALFNSIEAMRIHGGFGYSPEYNIERYYRDAPLLEKGEYGACEDLVKKAVQIGLKKDLGTEYGKDPRSRLEGIKEKNGQISTGWPALDKKLFGGFNRGELNIFAGGSGSGKSLFLCAERFI